MNNYYLKIILPSVVSILLFILTIFLIIIPRSEKSIMNGKREMIKELTNSAWSILSKYESDERNGLLTHQEAKEIAVSRIQYLRYGDEFKDYFWITDMYPIMIMHPYRSDLNGKDLTGFVDPNGKKLFVECVNTVKASGHGYVDYMWQWKDDSLHIVNKLSYVRSFKPWGWVIGTGIYIEDVKKEITALTKRLIWISIGISILIALLLLFNIQLSIKIEQKRIKAENALHESKEKYRTLVEAATEGLIMLIDGRISFSNAIISKITGLENEELIDLTLNEIISENNNKDILDTFSKIIVKEGQYEVNFRNKKAGFIEVLVTSTCTMFYNKEVNILTVRNITTDRDSSFSILDYEKLIKALNIGFFRINLNSKGRFIFANETSLRILEIDTLRELSEVSFIDLFSNSDDRKYLKKVLQEYGYVKNKVFRIVKKNNKTAYISVTLLAINNGNSKNIICDGTIEDITSREVEKGESASLIADLKSSTFMLERTVKEYLTPANFLDADTTLHDLIRAFSNKSTDNLILTKGGKDYIGIVTNNDIQRRILALKLDLDNPAYLIMSSPITYVNENTSLIEGINICEEKSINHLVVNNEMGIVMGILRIQDIYRALKDSLSFYIDNIVKSESISELKHCIRINNLLLDTLIKSEMSVKYLTRINSSASDSAIRKIIDLTILEIGEPPVPFSFICLGSEGRKEETLFTDQDNAIIFEDVPAERESQVNEYFNKLGEKVCDSLNYIGYAYCKGNIMAKNPLWCKPISVWQYYFANWINTPEPQNLLEATIFFDFRNIYGNDSLTDRLRVTISSLIKERSLFLYHLAYNIYNIKPQQISSGNIISDKGSVIIDLKEAVNLIVMVARAYSLQNYIWYSNTLERLNALKENQIIAESTIDEIIFAYNFLMKLRFRSQVELSAENQPLDNNLNTKNILDIELSILKKVLSLMPVYQNKVKIDFRIST